jgi:hypothetical protein
LKKAERSFNQPSLGLESSRYFITAWRNHFSVIKFHLVDNKKIYKRDEKDTGIGIPKVFPHDMHDMGIHKEDLCRRPFPGVGKL